MMLNHDVFESSISFGESALPVFMLDTCHSVKCQLIYLRYLKTQCVTINDFPSVVVYGEISFFGDESLSQRKRKSIIFILLILNMGPMSFPIFLLVVL